MKKQFLVFLKEFVDGNKTESIFWERLGTLAIERKIVRKPSKRGNSFSLPKSNSYASVNS